MLNISIEEYAENLRESGLVVNRGAVLLPNHEGAIDVGDGTMLAPSYKLAICYEGEWSAEEVYRNLRSNPDPNRYNQAELLKFAKDLQTGENLQLVYVLKRDLQNSDDATTDFLGMKLHIYAKRGDYAARISSGILKTWGMTLDKVKEKVQVSQNWECLAMEDLLREHSASASLVQMVAGSSTNMYVITNERRTDGAAVLLDTEYLEGLRQRFGNLMIIPSSCHEIIVLPMYDGWDNFDVLREIIREVNDTVVDYDLVLSYDAFKFTERGLEIA